MQSVNRCEVRAVLISDWNSEGLICQLHVAMSRRVGPTCHASQGVINIIGTLWWWIGKRDPDRCNPSKYSRYYLHLLQHSTDRNLPATFIYTHRIFLKLNSYHFTLHVAKWLIFVIEEKRGFLWGMNWFTVFEFQAQNCCIKAEFYWCSPPATNTELQSLYYKIAQLLSTEELTSQNDRNVLLPQPNLLQNYLYKKNKWFL